MWLLYVIAIAVGLGILYLLWVKSISYVFKAKDFLFYKHWDKVPSENIKLLIKKIPHIEKDSIKAFLDKGAYFVREGVSELTLYLDIEEFIKFLKTHNVSDYYNHKAVGDWAGKFS